MRPQLTLTLVLLILSASVCLAQRWEIGGVGGYAWYHDATITYPAGSASIGIAPKGGIGAIFGENLYKYIGGEVRWMYIWGQPRIRANGLEVTRPGFSNVIHYDFLIHTAPQEAKLRPFFAAGAGVRIYSIRDRSDFDQILLPGPNQNLGPFLFQKSRNETEALISAGGGLKYVVTHGLQVRLDFRAYMTPTPSDLFRPRGQFATHGWIYSFVPSLGVSYLF
jgi:hypothetical protein